MIKIKYLFLILLTPFLLLSAASPLYAQNTKSWDQINTSSGSPCVVDETATIQGFECLFYNVLQVVVYFAGIASFIMIIVGGFQYIFSHNDPKKTASASSTITMAIFGIVGVIVSWLIISLIKNFTGVDVTKFAIPGWQ